MQNIDDIKLRVRLELIHWQRKHKDDKFARCYLWFRATTPEHDGGILAQEERPAAEWLPVVPERLTGDPVEIIKNITPALWHLPVLEVEEWSRA